MANVGAADWVDGADADDRYDAIVDDHHADADDYHDAIVDDHYADADDYHDAVVDGTVDDL